MRTKTAEPTEPRLRLLSAQPGVGMKNIPEALGTRNIPEALGTRNIPEALGAMPSGGADSKTGASRFEPASAEDLDYYVEPEQVLTPRRWQKFNYY